MIFLKCILRIKRENISKINLFVLTQLALWYAISSIKKKFKFIKFILPSLSKIILSCYLIFLKRYLGKPSQNVLSWHLHVKNYPSRPGTNATSSTQPFLTILERESLLSPPITTRNCMLFCVCVKSLTSDWTSLRRFCDWVSHQHPALYYAYTKTQNPLAEETTRIVRAPARPCTSFRRLNSSSSSGILWPWHFQHANIHLVKWGGWTRWSLRKLSALKCYGSMMVEPVLNVKLEWQGTKCPELTWCIDHKIQINSLQNAHISAWLYST